MGTVVITGIGPSERRVIEILIGDITLGDRNNAMMVKTIRRQFDLRALNGEIEEILGDTRTRILERYRESIMAMIADQLDTEEGELEARVDRMVAVYAERLQNIQLTWEELEEAGYESDGKDGEIYGKEYTVDETALRWLVNRRTERSVWIEVTETDEDGKPEKIARPIPLAMMEAIAVFDTEASAALNDGEMRGEKKGNQDEPELTE